MAAPARILLTGPPGCGKTTVILRTLPRLSGRAAGFYTEEVRSPAEGGGGGGRIGFDVVTLDGRRGPLARAGGAGGAGDAGDAGDAGAPAPRVGRYRVDLRSFEEIGVRALSGGLEQPGSLLVIDELGKMEFLSERFVGVVDRIFESDHPILGTILTKPHPVANRIRSRPDVRIVEVTRGNRDALPKELVSTLSV